MKRSLEMGINTKRKGSRNERKARDILEGKGCMVCKSGGSFGYFDLWALNDSELLLIQVKSNRKPSKSEMEDIRGVRVPEVVRVGKRVFIFHDYVREPEVIEL